MRKNKNIISLFGWLGLLGCLLLPLSNSAQTNPSFKNHKARFSGTGQLATGNNTTIANINPVVTNPQLRYSNKSAALNFRLDLGEDYVKTYVSWNFTVNVFVAYTLDNTAYTKTLQITQGKPETIKTVDILSIVNSNSTSVMPLAVTLSSVGVDVTPANPLLQSYIDNNVRLTIDVNREFNTDVRYTSGLVTNPITVNQASMNNRLVTFSWQTPNALTFPNYEVQILKVFNSDPALANDLNQIGAVVDWSKALRVETQRYQNQVTITMAEGMGYYIWRVRPVGTYFEGGIANSENYGLWSSAPATSTAFVNYVKNVVQSQNNPTPHAFYFTDPDENLNWIYSRVFTEGDDQNKANPTGVKSSEGMNYANGLLMSRQSQKFNSSENTNIVSQTMIDYSGRPAMSTIPVPLQGHLNGYKLDFVKNNAGQLYTALHFDADNKVATPDEVQSTAGSNFAYYSQNPTLGVDNTNVPNAEGYPYKRTLFKTDGTNRVTEESGVGKTHALGAQGKTTRILYCTPTEDELIRIFGDEAPMAESVIKTITIDQNDVSSVTYTSKEGKTIATALVSETNPNLQNVYQAATPLTVTNHLNNKTVSSDKIVSLKRIAVPGTTSVKLTYLNSSLPGNSGSCASGNCNFKMRFYIKDLNKNVTFISDAVSTSTVLDNFTPSNSFNFANFPNWVFVSQTPSLAANIVPTGANFDQISLDAGEYIFVKEVFSPNSANYADSIVNAQNERTKPLIDAVLDKMKTINTTAGTSYFNTWVDGLRCRLDDYNSISPFCVLNNAMTSDSILKYLQVDQTQLPQNYVVPFYPDFSVSALTSNSVDPTMNDFSITSGCCGSMKTSLPKPPICVLCVGNPRPSLPDPNSITIPNMVTANHPVVYIPDSLMRYGIEDFINHANWNSMTDAAKVAAINDLVYHEMILPFKLRLIEQGLDTSHVWKYAPGHNMTSLKFMFANMLISQYYTGNAVLHAGNWWAASFDELSGGYNLTQQISAMTNLPYNYNCKKMYEAWYSNLEMINTFGVGGSDNILGTFNERDSKDGGNSGQNNGDDDENWVVKNKLVKGFLKRKISEEMEEFSQKPGGTLSSGRKESATSLINLFFDEVGYKFAAIIDGGTQPPHIPSAGPSFTLPSDFDATNYAAFSSPEPGNIYSTVNVAGTNYAMVNVFNVNGNSANVNTINSGPCSFIEKYYPYCLKPEWQFKYYHYNVYNDPTIADASLDLPNQVELDLQRFYNMPVTYLNTNDICQTPAALNYSVNNVQSGTFNFTHVNWSTSQRLSFYNAIKGAPVCYADKGLPNPNQKYDPNPPQCASTKADLYLTQLDFLNTTLSGIDNRRPEIRAAIQNELVSSCYTIVPCKTGPTPGLVTEKEITLMVDAVVNHSKGLINTMKSTIITAIDSYSANPYSPCTPYSAWGNAYGMANCELPTCTYTMCNELVLDQNNTLVAIPSSKIDVKLFIDCDQKILDMINGGSFLPNIPIAVGQGVTSPCNSYVSKTWMQPSCTPEVNSCSPTYSEKTTCPPSKFKKYSKTYSITATGN